MRKCFRANCLLDNSTTNVMSDEHERAIIGLDQVLGNRSFTAHPLLKMVGVYLEQ